MGQLFAEMFGKAREGFCLRPEAPQGCDDKIIRAHTVQKQGGLKAIAEDQHVLSLKDGIRSLRGPGKLIEPERMGVNSASTVMGFCGRHDTELFRPIEHGDVVLDDRAMLLLAFRAVSYEMFNKIIASRWAEIQRECDRGLPFEHQARAQQVIHYTLMGTMLAIEDTKGWKRRYDRAYFEKDYSNFWYHAVVFNQALPFVSCGGVMPEYDFNGRVSQSFGGRVSEMEHIAFNLTSFGGKSVAVFGWLGPVGGVAEAFVRSFAKLRQDDIANALLRFIFEHVENSFFRPSWWNAMPEAIRAALLARMKNGTLSGERSPFGLCFDGNDYLPGCSVEQTISRMP